MDYPDEWRLRHEKVPGFREELRVLCERYGFVLTAESCDECSPSLSVDYGWPLSAARWRSAARFPDREDEEEALGIRMKARIPEDGESPPSHLNDQERTLWLDRQRRQTLTFSGLTLS